MAVNPLYRGDRMGFEGAEQMDFPRDSHGEVTVSGSGREEPQGLKDPPPTRFVTLCCGHAPHYEIFSVSMRRFSVQCGPLGHCLLYGIQRRKCWKKVPGDRG